MAPPPRARRTAPFLPALPSLSLFSSLFPAISLCRLHRTPWPTSSYDPSPRLRLLQAAAASSCRSRPHRLQQASPEFLRRPPRASPSSTRDAGPRSRAARCLRFLHRVSLPRRPDPPSCASPVRRRRQLRPAPPVQVAAALLRFRRRLPLCSFSSPALSLSLSLIARRCRWCSP